MDKTYRKVYRDIRYVLANQPAVDNIGLDWRIWLIVGLFIISIILILTSCSIASETPLYAINDHYTDSQYVNAIKLAEGSWNYGIQTIRCTSEEACKRIALRTVHNNRLRYKEYGFREYPQFVQFLGSRYCPTTGRDLRASEKRVNKYWVRNMQWFLEHPRKG